MKFLLKDGAAMVLLMTFSLFTLTANGQKYDGRLQKLKQNPPVEQTLTYKIIPAEANTFGYDILSDNKTYIHQPSIPGLPGHAGFRKKQDAEKVAKLVMYKLSHNIMPPTVEKRELDSLKVKL